MCGLCMEKCGYVGNMYGLSHTMRHSKMYSERGRYVINSDIPSGRVEYL